MTVLLGCVDIGAHLLQSVGYETKIRFTARLAVIPESAAMHLPNTTETGLLVGNPMRHMASRHMHTCRFAMLALIVKENIRPECMQERPLVHAGQK